MYKCLKCLCNLKNPMSQLARWALELQVYNHKIEHRKDSLNYVSDTLSRIYKDAPIQLYPLQMRDKTTDPWYVKTYEQVLAALTELRNFKIIAGRLYFYKPNPAIDGVSKDHDA